MSEKVFPCPVCGEDARTVPVGSVFYGNPPKAQVPVCEEIIVPGWFEKKDLKRRPPLRIVARNYLVRCRNGHLRYRQDFNAHHVTEVPMKLPPGWSPEEQTPNTHLIRVGPAPKKR